jgi:hypothetical protein
MKHEAPTIHQKLRIYKRALKFVSGVYHIGICIALLDAQKEMDMYQKDENNINNSLRWKVGVDNPNNNIKLNFPEITRHKPRNKAFMEYWWDNDAEGKQIRIDILTAEIKLLEQTKKMNKNVTKL